MNIKLMCLYQKALIQFSKRQSVSLSSTESSIIFFHGVHFQSESDVWSNWTLLYLDQLVQHLFSSALFDKLRLELVFLVAMSGEDGHSSVEWSSGWITLLSLTRPICVQGFESGLGRNLEIMFR